MSRSTLDYSIFIAQLIQETKAREEALPLMDQTSGSRFLLHPHPTDKILLFFHGFTALPEQFALIGRAFYQAGYNVLIPLMPGHGIGGKWNRDNPPPLPENRSTYEEFAKDWLSIAHQFSEKVIVGGLSGGSTLAAWLALEYPQQVDRALVFAPYLSGSNKMVDLVVENLDVYFEWKTDPGVISFGYGGFLMPSLRLFLEMGQEIIERAKITPMAPMLIVSSESDRAVGNEDHQILFDLALKFQPKCWYHCFKRDLDIPHNMMTEAEGNQYFDLLVSIAKAYVESDITWLEVEAIGNFLAQGYSLSAAIHHLHLQERVSCEITALWPENSVI